MSQTQPAKRGFDADSYVPVSERLEQFYTKFPDGRVLTAIIEHDAQAGFILMRAEVYRNADDAQPASTGHAFESKDAGYVQKTSYVEVAETSAVGRALMLLNFETKRGLADSQKPKPAPIETHTPTDERQRQVLQIHGILKELNANLNRLGQAQIWTKEHLKNYVNKQFEVEDGMDSLNFESLHELHKDLSGQLEALTKRV